jgi:hypothetical protein
MDSYRRGQTEDGGQDRLRGRNFAVGEESGEEEEERTGQERRRGRDSEVADAKGL